MRRLMDARAVERATGRMAHEVLDDLQGAEGLLLVGIHSGGVPLARRLAGVLAGAEGVAPAVGEMDITLYRDDLYTGLEKPILGDTRLPCDLHGARVVLVDDVLFTGRTVRAAMDELMDFGRPACIRLAVLVDRGHRELPIEASYVGRRVQTRRSDRVIVRLDGDADTGVWLEA